MAVVGPTPKAEAFALVDRLNAAIKPVKDAYIDARKQQLRDLIG